MTRNLQTSAEAEAVSMKIYRKTHFFAYDRHYLKHCIANERQ